jgi:preprotein translocase subunit YajC
MRKNLAEGDEILTIGGLFGKIINIKEDVITLEIGADKLKVKVARWAIGRVVNKKEGKTDTKVETKIENKEEK